MDLSPISYPFQTNYLNTTNNQPKSYPIKAAKDSVSFTGGIKFMSGEKSIGERLFSVFFPKKSRFINELTEQVKSQEEVINALKGKVQSLKEHVASNEVKITPEQIKAEVYALKESALTMFDELKTLKQHCMSRVEEVMIDEKMEIFIPWKWHENTKGMKCSQKEELLQSLKNHGFQFKSEKYPDLDFEIKYDYPELYGAPSTELKKYKDDLLYATDVENCSLIANNRNFDFEKYSKKLSVEDFNSRGEFKQTNYLINTENNQLLRVEQFGGSGAELDNSLQLTREIQFKDGNPTKFTETRETTESKGYTYIF